MLKFKITNGKMGIDLKRLNITDMERQNDISSDVPYTDSMYTDDSDEITYKFWVEDLYGIQDGSHLSSITDIVINNDDIDNSHTFQNVTYNQEVIVDSISKAENTLSFKIKKEIPLTVDKLYIETRYNLIRYKDNRWEKMLVDKAWLDSALPEIDGVVFQKASGFCKEDGDAYVDDKDKIHILKDGKFDEEGYERVTEIKSDKCAYGKNERTTYDYNGNVVSDNTVFYYENETWNQIDLVGDTLEGCLNGQNINFHSFHLYDGESREAVKMEKGHLYYTCEDYIILDFDGTHYFGAPNETKVIEEENVVTYYRTTDYGREIIETIDYPKIYMYVDRADENGVNKVKIKQECHIESPNRLVFNYTTFAKRGKITKYETEWVIESNSLPRKEIKKVNTNLGDDGKELFESNTFQYGIVDNDSGDYPFQEGSIGGIDFRRDNFFYDGVYGTYSILYDKTVNVIQVPLTQKFENDLHHNDMLKTHFVDKTKASMINPIVDMEKDLYTPAIHNDGTTSDSKFVEINAKYKDAYKIIFNLHFREHRDTKDIYGNEEEWKCERDCYWNGTRVLEKEFNGEKKKIIDLNGRVYNYSLDSKPNTMENKYDYFSYFGVNPDEAEHYDSDNNIYALNDTYVTNRNDGRNKLKEYQSDLLSYLGFTNNDVKYQKSKLKKSFLRISFYDSDNIGNQNLLHTSTIFLDSGDLFAKYIKNVDTEDEYRKGANGSIYTSSEYNRMDNKNGFILNGEPMAKIGTSLSEDDDYTAYNVSGVRVNREPMRNEAININKGDLGDNIDELERLRMSSQIVVTDKYSSKHSSEGFYFYTYKTGDGGVFPSEIYMRVEFNHAGYGRTIPFMMPYIRKNEEDDEKGVERYKNRKNKIKTFDDICYDWSEIDFDKGLNAENIKDDDQIGYGTIRYMKYCHIKWKYRYDKDTQKHIYYLDPETYGTGATSNNGHGNNIILNLYEGKIR